MPHSPTRALTHTRPPPPTTRAIMAGHDPTGIKHNAFIEAHGAAREVVERGFRLNPRSIALVAVFGVFVPTLIYRGCVKDFVRHRARCARARV